MYGVVAAGDGALPEAMERRRRLQSQLLRLAGGYAHQGP